LPLDLYDIRVSEAVASLHVQQAAEGRHSHAAIGVDVLAGISGDGAPHADEQAVWRFVHHHSAGWMREQRDRAFEGSAIAHGHLSDGRADYLMIPAATSPRAAAMTRRGRTRRHSRPRRR
jgi:hypothetical protein